MPNLITQRLVGASNGFVRHWFANRTIPGCVWLTDEEFDQFRKVAPSCGVNTCRYECDIEKLKLAAGETDLVADLDEAGFGLHEIVATWLQSLCRDLEAHLTKQAAEEGLVLVASPVTTEFKQEAFMLSCWIWTHVREIRLQGPSCQVHPNILPVPQSN